MAGIVVSVTIDAALEDAWSLLADLGAIERYHPQVTRSYYKDESRGPGAIRRCEFPKGRYIDEQVIAWDEGRGYTLRAVAMKGMPDGDSELRFQLEEHRDQTVLTVEASGAIKGPLGPLVGLVMRPMMRKMLLDVARGFKREVESEVSRTSRDTKRMQSAARTGE